MPGPGPGLELGQTYEELANGGRQTLGASGAGDEASLGLGQGKVGRLGGDNQIALSAREIKLLWSAPCSWPRIAVWGGGRGRCDCSILITNHEGELEAATELQHRQRPLSAPRAAVQVRAYAARPMGWLSHRRAINSCEKGLADRRHAGAEILEVTAGPGTRRVKGRNVVEIRAS